MALLDTIFGEVEIADETLWHKRSRAPIFARTTDGGRIALTGQIWRRKHGDRWEYRQDEETLDEFERRIW